MQPRPCLVLIGVRMNGRKEVITIEDGYRESTESWASLLRDLRRRRVPWHTLSQVIITPSKIAVLVDISQ